MYNFNFLSPVFSFEDSKASSGSSVWTFSVGSRLWQYGLWSFQVGGTKLEIFLPKNQHTYSKEIIEF